jgi:Tfp pilus assembly protein PilF
VKYSLLILFLLLPQSGYLLADPPPEGDKERLQEIVELFRSNSSDEALRQLRLHETTLLEAISESKDAEAYLLLGRIYFYAEMDSKAKDSLNAALKYDPSLSDAHFFTGLIHKYAGDLDNAERSFRNAIELSNSSDDYFVELGRILEEKDDSNSALVEYKNALAINNRNFNANFNSATIYAIDGDNERAEKHYLAALEQEPDDLDSNYNLGQLYQNTSQHRLAIRYFSRIIELDATEWRAIAKIVQESEALGEIEARNAAIDRIYEVWREGVSKELQDQGFYIREQKQVEGGKLFVLEYFELRGNRARKFVFKLQDPATGQIKFDVSLGSYDETTQISRELGNIEADERIYHLDGYGPNGSHYTFAFFDAPPEYEVVREMALKALSGELSAISSTVPSNNISPQEPSQ